MAMTLPVYSTFVYVRSYVRACVLHTYVYLSPTMYVHVCVQVLDHITAGMEDILGHVGHNRIRVRSLNLYDVASFFSFQQTVTSTDSAYYSYHTCTNSLRRMYKETKFN